MTIRLAARRGSLALADRRSIRTSITTVLLPACRGSPTATISSPSTPAAKTFSFSSIVVKLCPGGMLRKVAQAATVSPSAVQTPPWTKPPGCRWRLSTTIRPRAWVSSTSSGSIPRSPGKLPREEVAHRLRRDQRAGMRRRLRSCGQSVCTRLELRRAPPVGAPRPWPLLRVVAVLVDVPVGAAAVPDRAGEGVAQLAVEVLGRLAAGPRSRLAPARSSSPSAAITWPIPPSIVSMTEPLPPLVFGP